MSLFQLTESEIKREISTLTDTDNDAGDWILMHDRWKRRYGKKEANRMFKYAFDKFGNRWANDSRLQEYAKLNDIPLSKNWEDSALDSIKSFSFFNEIRGGVKVLFWVLIGIAFFLVLFLFVFGKQIISTTGTVINPLSGLK